MPIHHAVSTIRPSQAEFGEIAYEVMNCVYAVHNEFGRFFDEAVYKKELANRLDGMLFAEILVGKKMGGKKWESACIFYRPFFCRPTFFRSRYL